MFALPRNASKNVMKGVIQKVRLLGEGGSLKSEQKRIRGGGSEDVCTFAFLKKMLRFSK